MNEGDYEEPYEQRMMVLQTDGHEEVEVWNCEVRYTKVVTRCGWRHHNYGFITITRDQPAYMSKEECRLMVESKKYVGRGEILGGEPPPLDLEPGIWKWVDYYSKGMRDTNGNCVRDSFIANGVAFTRSYETTTIKARIRKVFGLVDRATGKLSISTGLLATYAATMVEDVEGIYYWDIEEANCTAHLSNIYDEIPFTNTETKQTGGFVLRPERSACMRDCHMTQVNGIIACMDPHRVRHKLVYKPGKRADVKMLQVALSHLHITSTFRVDRKFTAVEYDSCMDRRLITDGQLADLAGNNNGNALRNLKIDGIGPTCRQWQRGGASGYVISCPTTNMTLVSYPNCTQEIPVVHVEDAANETAP